MSRLSREFTETQEKKRIAKRFIDPINNPKDKIVAELGATGKSNLLINQMTGYSDAQIGYRLRAWDIHRSDYRNGIVRPYTRMVLRIQDTAAFQQGLKAHLRTVVPHLFKKQKT